MKRVSVTDLKNRLSHYLRLVKRGETVVVVERSIPVAVLEAVGSGQAAEDALERLVHDGIVTPPRKPPEAAFFRKNPPVPCDVDAVRVLIEERGDR